MQLLALLVVIRHRSRGKITQNNIDIENYETIIYMFYAGKLSTQITEAYQKVMTFPCCS